MEVDGDAARPVVNGIEQAVAALGDLDHAALKARWRALRGGEPPKGLSRPLVLRSLAYAIQEKTYGGLPSALRRRLERLGAELHATGRIVNAEVQPAFRPGTRLVREWQNKTHEVTVLDHGFHWNGQTYRSLSAIAPAITGTRWNGHVFFGLKPRAPGAREINPISADQGAVSDRQARTPSANDRRESTHG